jgi:tRNA (guanine-N7-)-methyltransferase
LLPQLAVDLPACGSLNLELLFGGSRQPTWLEIGFGGGEHLAVQAEYNPQTSFIGCEVFENGIAKLLARIAYKHLENVRIFSDDARLLIPALPAASIDRVFILFPDPWPKRRHHKRRVVSQETLDGLAKIMTDNAELRLATDDCDYLCWMLETVTGHPAFEGLSRHPCEGHERPQDWPPTRYEEKARASGRYSTLLRARRRPRIDS